MSTMNTHDIGLQQLHVRLARLEYAFDDLLFGDPDDMHTAFTHDLKMYVMDPMLYKKPLMDRWSWVLMAMRIDLLVPTAQSLLVQLSEHRLAWLIHIVRKELSHNSPVLRGPPPPIPARVQAPKRRSLGSIFKHEPNKHKLVKRKREKTVPASTAKRVKEPEPTCVTEPRLTSTSSP